ncbi:hypothetical protein CCP3SC1AL1_110030 [Gammaproteobacteria bacterium]
MVLYPSSISQALLKPLHFPSKLITNFIFTSVVFSLANSKTARAGLPGAGFVPGPGRAPFRIFLYSAKERRGVRFGPEFVHVLTLFNLNRYRSAKVQAPDEFFFRGPGRIVVDNLYREGLISDQDTPCRVGGPVPAMYARL